MRALRFFAGVLALAAIVKCSENDDVFQRPFTRVETGVISNVTISGATYSGAITYLGTPVGEHGFFWSTSSNPTQNNSDVIWLGPSASEGKFSARAERDLSKNIKYFVRAFAKTGDRYTLGNIILFVSEGCIPPVVEDINPPVGVPGDTITITGSHFSNRPGGVLVRFNSEAGSVVLNSDSLIKVRVPYGLKTLTAEVSVVVAGNIGICPEKFNLDAASISTVSKVSVVAGDTILITGEKFSLKPNDLNLYLENVPMVILSATPTAAKVIVPFLRATASELTLKIVSAGITLEFRDKIVYGKASILGIQDEALITYGDTVRLTGQNLRLPDIKISFGNSVLTPFAIGASFIDFVIPLSITRSTNEISVSFSEGVIDFKKSVTLAPALVTGFSKPEATFLEEIEIFGKNFHPLKENISISFSGQEATVVSSSKKSIRFIVPSTISSCIACNQIQITVCDRAYSSSGMFSLAKPVISTFSPEVIVKGSALTITGSNFNPDNATFNNLVFAGVRTLAPVSFSSTQLTFDTQGLDPNSLITEVRQLQMSIAHGAAVPIRANFESAYTRKKDFPGPIRYQTVAVAAGGKAYVGFGSIGNQLLTDFYLYNPTTDQWRQLPDFPGTPRLFPIIFALGNFIYVGLGETTGATKFSDMWRFDIVAESWSKDIDFPGTPKGSPVSCVSGGSAFVLGGNTLATALEVWKFDGTSWQQKADMPLAGINNVFVKPNGEIYGFFGTAVYQHNNIDDTWAFRYNVSSQLSGAKGTVIGEDVFFWTQNILTTLYRHNLGAPTTTNLTLPLNLFSPAVVTINNKLYAFSPYQSSAFTAVPTKFTWEFDHEKYP